MKSHTIFQHAGLQFAPAPLALVALLALGATTHAHPGHAHEAGGIGWGIAHPFTGLDHLLAALATGMLAVVLKRPLLVFVFLAGGVIGGLGGASFGAVGGLESALALSVLAFGLLLAFSERVPSAASYLLTGFGAVAHGWAHVSETSTAAGITGIALGTAGIVAAGAGAGLGLRHCARIRAAIGTGIAAAAVAIMAGIV